MISFICPKNKFYVNINIDKLSQTDYRSVFLHSTEYRQRPFRHHIIIIPLNKSHASRLDHSDGHYGQNNTLVAFLK